MPSTLKPKHPHDCDRCVLLGAHIFEGTWYDLYFCPKDTLVARYGPNERCASRSHRDAAGRPSLSCPPLNTATRMATERGLIHAPDPTATEPD